MNGRNIAKKGISLEVVKRLLIYGAVILLLSAAQCSVFSVIKPFGATPNLILGAVVCIVLLDTPHAPVFALAAGFFIDAVGSTGLSFMPLFYFLLAALLSPLAEKMVDRFLSYCVLLVPALIADGLYTYFCFAIHYGDLPPVAAVLTPIFNGMLSSAVFCLPLLFIIRLSSKPIETKGKFSF